MIKLLVPGKQAYPITGNAGRNRYRNGQYESGIKCKGERWINSFLAGVHTEPFLQICFLNIGSISNSALSRMRERIEARLVRDVVNFGPKSKMVASESTYV